MKRLEEDVERTKAFLNGNKQSNKLEFMKLDEKLKAADNNLALEKSNRQMKENIL